MADDIVTRDVTDPWQEICDLRDEIERLQRWKVEACSVLADWDALYVDLGDRGELGQRKSAVVAAEIKRLRAEAAEDEEVRERMSNLLHGVANALHGGSLDGGIHSWHDLPEMAERLRADLEEAYDACRYALADAPRWRENAATVVAEWEARCDR